ncbi:MAG: TldD/PmbA family protein, partial [Thermoplasmata archaeon]|nr:TldD/PmbA family protein [Thermoplasmata archaeon]
VVKKAREAGAESAEAFAIRNATTGIQIERDSVKFTSSTVSSGVAVRILKEGRIGFSYTNRLDDLEGMIEEAIISSRFFPPKRMSFSSGGHFLPESTFYDDKVFSLEVEDGFEMLKDLITSAKSVGEVSLASGGLSWGEEVVAISTTEGLSRYDAGTRIGIYAYAVHPYGEGLISPGFEMQVRRKLSVDVSVVGKGAATIALKGANPRKLERAPETVVFRPDAFSNLLEFLVSPALYGERAKRGESFYSEKMGVRVGDQIMGEEIYIYEDPLYEEGVNSSTMDDEGVPSKRVPLVEKGVLKGYLFTLSSAAESGTESTSSALRAERLSTTRTYHSPPNTSSRRFKIFSGRPVKDPLGEVDEGIYVHDLLGAHTSNAVSGDFSVSTSTLFYVKDGEIKYPVKSVMLAGNIRDAMKRILFMGDDYREIPGSLTAVGLSVPTVAVKGIRVVL